MISPIRSFRILATGILLSCPGLLHAATSSGVSPTFTVDTRSASELSGRVIAPSTRLPVGGATVTVGAATATTHARTGEFRLTGTSVAPGTTVTVTKAGYSTARRAVSAPPGAKQIDLGDIPLSATLEVTEIIPQYDGLFLEGVSLRNRFDATVNWDGHTPGSVEWYINGTLRTTTPANGDTVSVTLDTANEFQPRTGQANKLEAVAVTSGGARSAAFALPVKTLPIPDFLQGVQPTSYFDSPELTFSYEFTYPGWETEAFRTVPFLGKFGWEFNFRASVDYALRSGEWEATLGGGTSGEHGLRGRRKRSFNHNLKPKFCLGNQELDFFVMGGANGVASLSRGFRVDEALVAISLDWTGEILTFYLTDYVPGTQWVRLVDKVLQPFGLDPNSIQRVRLYALVGAELRFVAELQPVYGFKETAFGLETGLEAAYEPGLKLAKLRIYAGGKVSATLQWPAGGSVILQKVTGSIYGGVEAEVFSIHVFKAEFALLDYNWVPSAAAAAPTIAALSEYPRVQIDGQEYLSIPLSESTAPTPAARSHLARGPERFLAGAPETTMRSMSVDGARIARVATPSSLDAFRQMGRGGILGTGTAGDWTNTQTTAPGDGGVVASGAAPADSGGAQAELPLLANAYPGASPALASKGNELMLLYVQDNGGADLQFTDIAWTRFDGTNWSAPTPIATDTRGEFIPQVRFDGNGDAIAVWHRVKDPAFTTVDVTAMAARIEIVWSRWDHATGVWSIPAALTDNVYLDHSPQLCGPMTGGDVLLVWTANEANQFTGSGADGAAENSRFMTARWSATTKTWDAPATLLSGLHGEMAPILDGQGSRAVLAWARDMNDDVTTATDSELFYCEWQSGSWGPAVRFTDNAVSDTNVRVAVTSGGERHLVWRQGSNLVWSRNFGAPVLVRAGADTTGFADYALTVGPGGNVVMLWQEMSDRGSDAHYRIYDAASATWGQDDLLTADAPLERSFAPVWDAAGNLTVAYLKVQTGKTTKSLTLEDGSVLTIDNVPESGQVDLYATKRALVRDLSLRSGDFVVRGENYLPGDNLTLKTTVRNSGNLAVQNVKVAFYNGNPAAGGTKIGEATVSGWLTAADKTDVSISWVLPTATTAVQLFAVVDPDGAITENREDNNQQSVTVGGSDLVVRYVASTVSTDGSMRVIAEVQNMGMPATPATTSHVFTAGGSTPLAQVAVPALQPGEIAQVALELPAGSHPGWEAAFDLAVDVASAIADTDRDNNEATFSAILGALPTINQTGTVTTNAGGATVLSVTANSGQGTTYQWQVLKPGAAGWTDILGATTSSFTMPSTQQFLAGDYRVVVTFNGASAITAPVAVAVQAPPASTARLMNLSTRALCLTGDGILIPGFVIEGSGSKRMLVRAIGPTLNGFGVVGTLPDPQMILKRQGTGGQYEEFASNDDWGTNANVAEIRAVSAALGAFGLAEGSTDSALLATLPAGYYTVLASDKNGSTGVAMVELYDADIGSATARLINISNRGQVGRGNDIMIPGFVVSDEGSRTFLIRAVGPTLAGFGVTGTLDDPQLRIFQRISGTETAILENNDWGIGADATQTAAVATQVGAFPLTSNSKDAAFVVTLSPGIYTVNASGVGGTTGNAIVEVYVVP